VKPRFGRMDALALALIAGTTVVTWVFFAHLPARIATHFDIHGVANGWMSRSVGAWILPSVSLGVWALLRPGARILPSDWRARAEESPMDVASLLSVSLMSSLQWVILYAALSRPRSVGGPLALLLVGFWIALGLVLPRVRRNPWLGIRTPWTLSSDENWARTHRFAGFTLCIGGVLALVCSIAASASLGVAAAILVASAVAPAVYSFLLARRLSGG
jgi:uncharacterized membrane protein